LTGCVNYSFSFYTPVFLQALSLSHSLVLNDYGVLTHLLDRRSGNVWAASTDICYLTWIVFIAFCQTLSKCLWA